MGNKDYKRVISAFLALSLNFICLVSALSLNLNTSFLKMLGSFFATGLVCVGLWKFPLRFYITALIFTFIASSLGSCINLYYYLNEYDVVVHYISGIFLFEGGLIVFDKIVRNDGLQEKTKIWFAFLFSCALAGIWEIYEYLIDVTLSANMQGSKQNTMHDIIAGTLGAVTGLLLFCSLKKYKKLKDK